ncbi:MotA/TolQ/ExbB proton channel family protein [Candidatus Venteria ishoeyi]|uniref:MotA/TolQ/ExbB proton channel family protein n=1 Tax=Candidatus Venteria ishoeyi TaxID=1899563 RepID=A0A1H6FIU0_9GAMM|nr:MotA/TolQ/ExbB proton channel family protein [Candidatus Venteria ishoeyi]MDM8546597.1 MotA/TolQ/ExbB proton channel family protein [Candidatus Venteria ishoeyi]SEH08934.1 MotA/TolQ/ExbB proton channel family protein [Candidatus Venteria ishoeyi]
MPYFSVELDILLDFMELGGAVLWVIFFTSLLMWTLIIERYWFFHFTYPRYRKRWQTLWNARKEHQSWYAHRVREGLIAQAENDLRLVLPIIEVLTRILPLLGLLGTVVGMVKTFDTLNYFGMDNIRAMMSSISIALITTMAGLLTALSGLYFSANLSRRVHDETRKMADLLTFD